jgi:hypothetical protein
MAKLIFSLIVLFKVRRRGFLRLSLESFKVSLHSTI